MTNLLRLPLTSLYNEQELLQAVSMGSHKAFTKLFNGYHDGLFQYLMHITADRDTSKEIILDVFTSVWLQRENLVKVTSFRDWLFIVTRNQLLHHFRLGKKTKTKVVHLSNHPGFYIEDRILDHEYEAIFRKAVEQLPPKQQEAFLLSRQLGYTNRAIAQKMGIAPGSVKKYLQWAQRSVIRFIRSAAGSLLLFFYI